MRASLRHVIGSTKQTLIGSVGRVIAKRRPRRVDLPLARWSLAVGTNDQLALRGIDLAELTETFGSPLHVVDMAALRANAAAISVEPRVRPFVSYKTNPIPAVLGELHSAGIGAEVISAYELWLALQLGVPGSEIIYNGPAKSFESLVTAVQVGALINANSLSEVEVIRRAAVEAGQTASIGFRVSLPHMWGGQFGIADEALLVETIRSALTDDQFHVRSLHFHAGFGLRTESALSSHIAAILDCCQRIHAQTGWYPAVLDVGGSLTTPSVASIPRVEYRLNRALATDLLPPDPSDTITLDAAVTLVGEMCARAAADLGVALPELVVEPGRALMGDTQMLLTSVFDVKTDRDVVHAVMDAGLNLTEPLQNEYHQLFSVTAPTAPHDTSYRLVGPICTPADVLYTNWRLPELSPGHVLAIMDVGAYFVPFSTSFSFPRPAIVAIDGDGQAPRLIRRAETFQDIVAYDVPSAEPKA